MRRHESARTILCTAIVMAAAFALPEAVAGEFSIGEPTATVTVASGTPAVIGADVAKSLELAGQASSRLMQQAAAWIGEGMRRAPALVFGLAVIGAAPVLAGLGLLLRGRSANASPDAASTTEREILKTRAVTEGLAWPAGAMLFVDGEAGPGRAVGPEMMRIGREDDNDLCLRHPTVHRYHAIVRRTPESDFIVVDLSARDGNGVLLNGERVGQARLRDGDVIALGKIRLRFEARPT